MSETPELRAPHHLSRLMTPELDPTHGAKPEPLRRLWPALVAGTLVLGLFNAQGLEKWAERLPESPVTYHAIVGAQDWKVLMERLGPAAVFAQVRRAFREFRGQGD